MGTSVPRGRARGAQGTGSGRASRWAPPAAWPLMPSAVGCASLGWNSRAPVNLSGMGFATTKLPINKQLRVKSRSCYYISRPPQSSFLWLRDRTGAGSAPMALASCGLTLERLQRHGSSGCLTCSRDGRILSSRSYCALRRVPGLPWGLEVERIGQ